MWGKDLEMTLVIPGSASGTPTNFQDKQDVLQYKDDEPMLSLIQTML